MICIVKRLRKGYSCRRVDQVTVTANDECPPLPLDDAHRLLYRIAGSSSFKRLAVAWVKICPGSYLHKPASAERGYVFIRYLEFALLSYRVIAS